MKVKSPQSIYLKGHRQQAVLLLHSFTGTVRDVKHLAQQLNEEGFTCYVPSYPGHGLPLKEFKFLKRQTMAWITRHITSKSLFIQLLC